MKGTQVPWALYTGHSAAWALRRLGTQSPGHSVAWALSPLGTQYLEYTLFG
jgi:hypothetical protein